MARKIITGNRWLEAVAADSYARMIAAGCPGGVTDAGRDPQAQINLFLARYKPQATGSGPYGDVRHWRGTRYVRVSAAGPVGVPGTSRHESGLALDLPEPARTWVRNHGAAYGWIGGIVKGEPWHFEYQAARDTKKPKPARTGNDDLPLRKGSAGPRVGRLQAGLRKTFPAYAKSVSVKRGVLIEVDDIYGDQTDAWVKEFQRRVGIEDDGIVGPVTIGKLAAYGIKV